MPYPLRLRLAWDHNLRKAVLAVVLRAIFGFQCRRAKQRGFSQPRCESITAAQNFGGQLNLNLHFHVLIPDGVFIWDARRDAPRFVTLPAPSTTDIQGLVAVIARRVKRLLRRRGLLEEWVEPSDEEHPFQRASAQGRAMLCEPSGRRIKRLG